jgi:PhzF family phenazine biosynthesis protein
MKVQRIAAFTHGTAGGNPAGVVLCAVLPSAGRMQAMAAEVGYSETAFAAPSEDAWHVRYFAPEMEVPFCGHATIALGAALALANGEGKFSLQLKDNTRITVEGRWDGMLLTAALQSPETRSAVAPRSLVTTALDLFSYNEADLDPRLPAAIIEAGARHLLLALSSRQRLAEMRYDLKAGRQVMNSANLITISLVHAETEGLFHARNPFAAGGVYEDPATGSAAAALAGYLRDLQWPHGGAIHIVQGDDMGMPSRLHAQIGAKAGESIRVSGTTRRI